MKTPPITSTAVYPRLLRRIRATFIDYLIFVVIIVAWWFCLETIEFATPLLSLTPPLILIFILDPVLVSLTGGTPGHHLMGLKIYQVKTGKNLNILFACIRSFFRFCLSWLTFIFVLITKKHQAIHDLIVGSVVILRDPESHPLTERFTERDNDPDKQPVPVWKRLLIIAIYNMIAFFVLTAISELSLNKRCIESESCSSTEQLLIFLISTTWLYCISAITVYGWRGKLPGGKPTQRD